ncbi:MAG: hypothetical protein ACYDCU_10160, partial [Candidatus Acidiferrales bacterium]
RSLRDWARAKATAWKRFAAHREQQVPHRHRATTARWVRDDKRRAAVRRAGRPFLRQDKQGRRDDNSKSTEIRVG